MQYKITVLFYYYPQDPDKKQYTYLAETQMLTTGVFFWFDFRFQL